jgi:hypothetical protein
MDGIRAGAAGPELMDPLLALVLDRLEAPVLTALPLFPPDGAPIVDIPAGFEDSVQHLLDLELVDPDGLVSFRVRLAEPDQAGLRLSRLGRAVASALRAG